jgi:hypothetical protein
MGIAPAGARSKDLGMNRLLLLPLVIPFACLAFLSSIGFLAVMAIGGAMRSVDAIRWSLGLRTLRSDDYPKEIMRNGHPLNFVEKQPS